MASPLDVLGDHQVHQQPGFIQQCTQHALAAGSKQHVIKAYMVSYHWYAYIHGTCTGYAVKAVACIVKKP